MTESCTIVAESSVQREEIRSVNRAAFGNDMEADLVDALRDGGFGEVSLVALVQGLAVGHIFFSRVTLVTPVGSHEALALAPMAVLPQFQRQGIGTKIMETGLAECRRRGHRIVFVLGHPDFYSRFGFSSASAEQIESPFGGGDAWMALELTPQSLEGVCGRIEFSPPFNAFL
jgi:putative acetyltransferase